MRRNAPWHHRTPIAVPRYHIHSSHYNAEINGEIGNAEIEEVAEEVIAEEVIAEEGAEDVNELAHALQAVGAPRSKPAAQKRVVEFMEEATNEPTRPKLGGGCLQPADYPPVCSCLIPLEETVTTRIVTTPTPTPDTLLEVKPSSLPDAGLGLWAVRDIKEGSVIGEYHGPVVDDSVATDVDRHYTMELPSPPVVLAGGPIGPPAVGWVLEADPNVCVAARANSLTPAQQSTHHFNAAIGAGRQIAQVTSGALQRRFEASLVAKVKDRPGAVVCHERLFVYTLFDVYAGEEIFLYYGDHHHL